MNQTGHIFGKDARHFRWEVGIALALLVAFTWIFPYTFMPAEWIRVRTASPDAMRGVAGLLGLLVPVSWWVIVTRLVQEENLVGDQQWWITKPYEWPQLLGSKLLFLGAFILAPLLVAQCVLLAVGGFRPFAYLPNLGFGLVLMAGLVVIPLMAIAAVTATFGRMTLTLLGLVVALIVYAVLLALAFQPQGITVSDPVSVWVLFVVFVGACCAAIVLQYARRRVWVARLVLIAVVVCLIAGVAVGGNSLAIGIEYPQASAPLQLNYDSATQYNTSAQNAGNKRVGIPVPVNVSGIGTNAAINLDAMQVTAEAPDGKRWAGEWEQISGARYRASDGREVLPAQVSKGFYDTEKTQLVTLRMRFAVSALEARQTVEMALPSHEFSVPDFGICTPVQYRREGQFSDLSCRAALHQPPLTLAKVQWSDDPCSANPAENAAVSGEGWAGDIVPELAEFGLSPVVQVGFGLSNQMKMNVRGEPAGPRYLCAGSPISFTPYSLTRRSEYDVTFVNVRMSAMQAEGGGEASH